MIPYGHHNISEQDIQEVVDVLRSEFLTQGPVVERFEKAVSSYTGANYGVATNSATSALHLACRALGLGTGDILWTSPITFVASANCALYCNAEVDFVDIDPKTWNMSIDALEQKLEDAEKLGKLPKIVIPVHLCGLPCDMDAILELSKKYGFFIIEDASHAIGARYRDEQIGKCNYSDITIFSFHPVKIITTGEGGMAMTNKKEIADKMMLLRSHGITRDPEKMTHPPDGPWYYQQIDLGFNYRMTDFQAALGLSQLQHIDNIIETRNKIASRYNEMLSSLPLQLTYCSDEKHSAFHIYVVLLKRDKVNRSHRDIFNSLRQKGIGVNLHYIPVHTQPYYMEMGFNRGDFPQAEAYYERAITLPIFPELTMDMQNQVISSVVSALE